MLNETQKILGVEDGVLRRRLGEDEEEGLETGGTAAFLAAKGTNPKNLLYGNVFWILVIAAVIVGGSFLHALMAVSTRGMVIGTSMRWRRLLFVAMWYLYVGLAQSASIAIVHDHGDSFITFVGVGVLFCLLLPYVGIFWMLRINLQRDPPLVSLHVLVPLY